MAPPHVEGRMQSYGITATASGIVEIRHPSCQSGDTCWNFDFNYQIILDICYA